MASSSEIGISREKRRLLYIDDDTLARKSLTALLETLGYEIESADSAAVGLELFRNGGHNLVITDMNMPEMNGMRLTREIKKISPSTPVIVISGSIHLDRDADLGDVEPDCVLIKPLPFDEFSGHLRRLLQGEPKR